MDKAAVTGESDTRDLKSSPSHVTQCIIDNEPADENSSRSKNYCNTKAECDNEGESRKKSLRDKREEGYDSKAHSGDVDKTLAKVENENEGDNSADEGDESLSLTVKEDGDDILCFLKVGQVYVKDELRCMLKERAHQIGFDIIVSGKSFVCSRANRTADGPKRRIMAAKIPPSKRRRSSSFKCGCKWFVRYNSFRKVSRTPGNLIRVTSLNLVHTNGCNPSQAQLFTAMKRSGAYSKHALTEKEANFTTSFFACVEEHVPLYISRMTEAIAIPSVSANLETYLPEIHHMMDWTKFQIESLGGNAILFTNPKASPEQPLPPILLGELITDPQKKTVCVYGHLDVQSAKFEDGWDSDPFTLTERDGKLYGRGSIDNKGPALAWLWVVQAHNALGKKLPVNIKFMFEGMEESGSAGMFEAIIDLSKSGQFLNDVDFFCITDNFWLGKNKPCLTYGLGGIAYFELSVQCAENDLPSDVLAGTIHESMTDLIKLMSSLVDSETGKVLVDGVMDDVMDDVAPVTEEEEKLYGNIDFDMLAFKVDNKVLRVSDALLHKDMESLLMSRWRNPTLSLHGIEGAFSGTGAKTVIPSDVKGKFSMRLVPGQDPARIEKVIEKHFETEFAKLKSPNKMQVSMVHGAKAWVTDPNHPNYQAGARAIERVYGMEPDYTREGSSIPITSFIEEATQMNVILLPVGSCDDMAHTVNENYSKANMVNSIKVFGMYLHEIAKIKGPKPSLGRC